MIGVKFPHAAVLMLRMILTCTTIFIKYINSVIIFHNTSFRIVIKHRNNKLKKWKTQIHCVSYLKSFSILKVLNETNENYNENNIMNY